MTALSYLKFVMPGLDPGIHDFRCGGNIFLTFYLFYGKKFLSL